MRDTTGKSENRNFKNLSAMSLGSTMVVGVVLFTYLGYLIDKKRGTGQTWTLVGIFLGLFYCGYEVWKLVRTSSNGRKGK